MKILQLKTVGYEEGYTQCFEDFKAQIETSLMLNDIKTKDGVYNIVNSLILFMYYKNIDIVKNETGVI